MVKKLRYVPVHVDTRIVTVKTELMTLFLDPGVETPAVPPEAHAEEILVLGGVSQQKASLWLLIQQRFCLVPGITE